MKSADMTFSPGIARFLAGIILGACIPAVLLGPTLLDWLTSRDLLVDVLSRGNPPLLGLALLLMIFPWLWLYVSYDIVTLTRDGILVTHRMFGTSGPSLFVRYEDVVNFEMASDDESTFEKHIFKFRGVNRYGGGMLKVILRGGKNVQFDVGYLDQKRLFQELHRRVYPKTA